MRAYNPLRLESLEVPMHRIWILVSLFGLACLAGIEVSRTEVVLTAPSADFKNPDFFASIN